ncbi:MAG: FAD-dependent oxidoreductase [Chitinophagaceae bacterium]|nr:FAD-dependent oxidoreductase [Oligoflexus sp.]
MPPIFQTMLSPLTRRTAVKASSLGFLTLPFAKSAKAAVKPAQRLAIIGGGIGGVASAYFAGPEWSIDLFESRDRLGGHADTIQVNVEGESCPVDVGADFFAPQSHPLYWAFLEHVGIRTPDNAKTDLTIQTKSSLNIFSKNDGDSLFNSINTLSHPIHAVSFLRFTQEAREWISGDAPYSVSMGEWIDNLILPQTFKDNVLTPWLSSLSCSKVIDVRRQSARSHLRVVAKNFPKNPLAPIITYHAKIGLGGYIQFLQNRCENLSVKLNAAVSRLEEVNGQWFVTTSSGRDGPYDAVVVNAPPHVSKNFFSSIPWASELASLLGRQEYFPARVVVHTDPVYMPLDRKTWASQNVEVDSQFGESSHDVGSFYESVTTKKLSLFKSWASHRNNESKKILMTRDFVHPLSTPESLDAIKSLRDWQGRAGLYFSGHFTAVTDLHETALFSALETARRISPDSKNVLAFEQLIADQGLDSIDYNVP